MKLDQTQLPLNYSQVALMNLPEDSLYTCWEDMNATYFQSGDIFGNSTYKASSFQNLNLSKTPKDLADFGIKLKNNE